MDMKESILETLGNNKSCAHCKHLPLEIREDSKECKQCVKDICKDYPKWLREKPGFEPREND